MKKKNTYHNKWQILLLPLFFVIFFIFVENSFAQNESSNDNTEAESGDTESGNENNEEAEKEEDEGDKSDNKTKKNNSSNGRLKILGINTNINLNLSCGGDAAGFIGKVATCSVSTVVAGAEKIMNNARTSLSFITLIVLALYIVNYARKVALGEERKMKGLFITIFYVAAIATLVFGDVLYLFLEFAFDIQRSMIVLFGNALEISGTGDAGSLDNQATVGKVFDKLDCHLARIMVLYTADADTPKLLTCLNFKDAAGSIISVRGIGALLIVGFFFFASPAGVVAVFLYIALVFFTIRLVVTAAFVYIGCLIILIPLAVFMYLTCPLMVFGIVKKQFSYVLEALIGNAILPGIMVGGIFFASAILDKAYEKFETQLESMLKLEFSMQPLFAGNISRNASAAYSASGRDSAQAASKNALQQQFIENECINSSSFVIDSNKDNNCVGRNGVSGKNENLDENIDSDGENNFSSVDDPTKIVVNGKIDLDARCHPAPGTTFTSGYGPRWGRMHRGLDFAAPRKTPIYNNAFGLVTFVLENCIEATSDRDPNVECGGRFGNNVRVLHCDGTTTVYAHLVTNGSRVKVGDVVSRGVHIADMGSTGGSTGPHLHFECRTAGGSRPNPIGICIRSAKTSGAGLPSIGTVVSSSSSLLGQAVGRSLNWIRIPKVKIETGNMQDFIISLTIMLLAAFLCYHFVNTIVSAVASIMGIATSGENATTVAAQTSQTVQRGARQATQAIKGMMSR